jgi:hypothetical protein
VAVTVLETLSRDDLATYREYTGMVEGIQSLGSGNHMSPQDVRDFYIRYWEWVEDTLERYGVEGEEAEEAKISVYTGQIYVGSED